MVEGPEDLVMPDMELVTDDGRLWRLSNVLKSSPVAMVSYRGDWCPRCMSWWVGLGKLYPAFEEAGIALVGVCTEPPERIAMYRSELEVPFTLLSDPQLTLENAIGTAHGDRRVRGTEKTISYLQPSYCVIPDESRRVSFLWKIDPSWRNLWGAVGRMGPQSMLDEAIAGTKLRRSKR